VTPANKNEDTSTRGQYGTAARFQMDDRRLLLRGGPYDGQTWVGVVNIGERVFCGGDAPWSMAGLYVVSDVVEVDADGESANVAVPAFATSTSDPEHR
jgi:hypothetical protein